MEGVSMSATLKSIRTDNSGGWVISFDVPQTDSEEILKLAKLMEHVFQLGIVVRDF